jgi:hypothetical protein
MDLDQEVQPLDFADDRANAWAISGIQDRVSEERVKGVGADCSCYHCNCNPEPRGSVQRGLPCEFFEWEGDDAEGSVPNPDDNDPVLVGVQVDVVVRVRVNFDEISQSFNFSDQCPDAWAFGGKRDDISAEEVQGV